MAPSVPPSRTGAGAFANRPGPQPSTPFRESAMLRITAAALLLLSACTPSRQNEPPNPEPRPGVGVLVNSTRGRCTHVITGGSTRRVCLPRGRKPAPLDTARADSAAAPAESGR